MLVAHICRGPQKDIKHKYKQSLDFIIGDGAWVELKSDEQVLTATAEEAMNQVNSTPDLLISKAWMYAPTPQMWSSSVNTTLWSLLKGLVQCMHSRLTCSGGSCLIFLTYTDDTLSDCNENKKRTMMKSWGSIVSWDWFMSLSNSDWKCLQTMFVNTKFYSLYIYCNFSDIFIFKNLVLKMFQICLMQHLLI